MFLRKGKNNGKVYLSIVRGYWDKASGKSRTNTVKTLGYLEKLEEAYPDPIAHFTQVAREMSREGG
jgi:hypothetical protein